jgi:hypothetical protein
MLQRLIGKRGVSEVVGAILIAVIVLAMSMSWVAMEASHSNEQNTSVVDMMKSAEKSLQQSLSLSYYYKQGNSLNLLLYNYGTENSTPQLALINQNVAYWQTIWNFKWYTVTDSKGDFGSQLGQTTYAGTAFTFNWAGIPIYDGQSTHIGYQATTMYFTGSTTITIKTSDGMEVYIDGQAVFQGNAWKEQTTQPTPAPSRCSLELIKLQLNGTSGKTTHTAVSQQQTRRPTQRYR